MVRLFLETNILYSKINIKKIIKNLTLVTGTFFFLNFIGILLVYLDFGKYNGFVNTVKLYFKFLLSSFYFESGNKDVLSTISCFSYFWLVYTIFYVYAVIFIKNFNNKLLYLVYFLLVFIAISVNTIFVLMTKL